MYYFLIGVHVIVCIFLILVVLLQAGRGGGMSGMIGGGQPQSLFGTQTNAFMTRATEVFAVLFVVTSLTLGIMTTQRGKSLVVGRTGAGITLPAGTQPADAQAALNALLAESKKDQASAPAVAETSAPAVAATEAAPAPSGGDKS